MSRLLTEAEPFGIVALNPNGGQYELHSTFTEAKDAAKAAEHLPNGGQIVWLIGEAVVEHKAKTRWLVPEDSVP